LKKTSKEEEIKKYNPVSNSKIEPVISKLGSYVSRPVKKRERQNKAILNYELPKINLLNKGVPNKRISKNLEALNKNMSEKLPSKVQEYGVEAKKNTATAGQ
jgi:hypothetical protein